MYARRHAAWLVAWPVMGLLVGAAQAQGPTYYRDLVGKKAKNFYASKKNVINSEQGISLKRLRGSPVLLQFGFLK